MTLTDDPSPRRHSTAMQTKTKAKIGAKTAKVMAEHPTLRKAGVAVAPPAVKVGFRIGRRRARRRAHEHAERLQEFARTAGDTLATYGPTAAEALGLTEPPKQEPKTVPALAVGAVLGAGAMYLLEPNQGAARRARLQRLVGGIQQRRQG
jgi:hypothetical protein